MSIIPGCSYNKMSKNIYTAAKALRILTNNIIQTMKQHFQQQQSTNRAQEKKTKTKTKHLQSPTPFLLSWPYGQYRQGWLNIIIRKLHKTQAGSTIQQNK